jgi:GLPGLI family protein
MKIILLMGIIVLYASFLFGQTQKVVGDCTIIYAITSDNDSLSKALSNTTKILYVRGKEVRTDLESPIFIQSMIYNSLTGSAVILKEVNGIKYMSSLDSGKWRQYNDIYNDMNVVLSNESKTILGYECKKAISTLKDGSVMNIYYATDIAPSTPENKFQFKDIPGFVLEYESTTEDKKNSIIYTAVSINLLPVPAYKFVIPTKGYRILDN